MGLNRSEELIWAYVQKHPDERHHWKAKVSSLTKMHPDRHDAASALETELRRYYDERAAAVKTLAETIRIEGLRRASLRNLAEYLMQIWGPVLPAKPRQEIS